MIRLPGQLDESKSERGTQHAYSRVIKGEPTNREVNRDGSGNGSGNGSGGEVHEVAEGDEGHERTRGG